MSAIHKFIARRDAHSITGRQLLAPDKRILAPSAQPREVAFVRYLFADGSALSLAREEADLVEPVPAMSVG
jgi:hypothetical protein